MAGECLITADHGNAEQMNDHQTGQSHTAHTSNLVPLIYVGRDAEPVSGGALSDIRSNDVVITWNGDTEGNDR